MLVQHILFLCFAASVCARDRLKPFVSGGVRAKMETSPWHAGIYTKNTAPYKQICGGTLISHSVVVSAAHCFSTDRERPSVSNFAVAVGKIYRPWNDPHDIGSQRSDVIEIRIPPRYQGAAANFQDDIALVFAAKEFNYTSHVRPACFSFDSGFDEAQLQEGKLGKVVGWGLTGAHSPPSQVLQAASLPSVAIDKCIDGSPLSFRSSITGDKICAGYNNGTAVCRGDSGGGLIVPALVGGYEQFFLHGVVSTAPAAGSEAGCNIYTWATFTHLLRHEHFVTSAVPEPDVNCSVDSSDAVEDRYSEAKELGKDKEEMKEDKEVKKDNIPRLQRCQCTCPPGTVKTRHGKYCRRT